MYGGFHPSLYASCPPLSSFNLFFLLGSYKLKDNEGEIKMAKTIMVGGVLEPIVMNENETVIYHKNISIKWCRYEGNLKW